MTVRMCAAAATLDLSPPGAALPAHAPLIPVPGAGEAAEGGAAAA
ncbi:MAG: hypothetical protein VYD87_20135 [Pseudomonadota bacterium]|nr:hypothetical protein [Pseudomonadota bacterium]MEE3099441.1 hypothetical protein [Pseudomonadota bacterium]